MRRALTVKQLEIFLAIVVSGSITNAMRSTGLSQSSISQHLARLEEVLGTQLIVRDRSNQVTLTPAGEYWHREALDLVGRFDKAIDDHSTLFAENGVSLHIGTTPTIRGRFLGRAAEIALEVSPGATFSHFFGVNSRLVVERLELHQLNCVLVNDAALRAQRGSFTITKVFEDNMAWIVPANIPKSALADALAGDPTVADRYPAFRRYVSCGPDIELQQATDDWYRSRFPDAIPSFKGQTYAFCADIVSAGLATAHCPLSLLPNLPPSQAGSIGWYRLEGLSRDMVLAMPKHLMTLRPYSLIHERLRDFASQVYAREMAPRGIEGLENLLRSAA